MCNHTLMGGKLSLYKRKRSNYWQCAAFFGGKNHRVSSKEESLSKAKDVAEDWYLELMGKHKRGELRYGKSFKVAAVQFLREYEIITQGQRNQKYVDMQRLRLEVHVIPFFGEMCLSEITAGKVQEYRIHRHEQALEKYGKPPARSTLHQEIVALRQTLKTAVRHEWLDRLGRVNPAKFQLLQWDGSFTSCGITAQCLYLWPCLCGGTGRRAGFKIPFPLGVRVRVSPEAPTYTKRQ